MGIHDLVWRLLSKVTVMRHERTLKLESSAKPVDGPFLALFTPSGELIPNPSQEDLAQLIFETDWAETWGDEGLVTYGWFLSPEPGGQPFNSVAGKPELFFFGRKPYGFCFIHRTVEGDETIPSRDHPSDEQVIHFLGGNEHHFPVTGFVPPLIALDILREFTRNGQPEPSIRWVPAPPI